MGRRYFEALLLRANKQGKEIHGTLPYNSLSADLGGYFEVLKPGVFSESLKSGDRIYSLWQHKQDQPLGHTDNGTLVLTDGPKALKIRIIPPDTTWGRDVLESVSRDLVTGFSFGFKIPLDGDRWVRKNLREVHRAQLIEVSPVTFPCYSASVAVARSIPVQDPRSDQERKTVILENGLVGFIVDDKVNWSEGVLG